MSGANISDVQRQLGHSSLATTDRYLAGLGADGRLERLSELGEKAARKMAKKAKKAAKKRASRFRVDRVQLLADLRAAGYGAAEALDALRASG